MALVKEWVTQANKYAREKYQEMEIKRGYNLKEYDNLEKRKQQLQERIDKP